MFKAGDKVRCIDAYFTSGPAMLVQNRIYTIDRVSFNGNIILKENNKYYVKRRFELADKLVAYPTLRSDYV